MYCYITNGDEMERTGIDVKYVTCNGIVISKSPAASYEIGEALPLFKYRKFCTYHVYDYVNLGDLIAAHPELIDKEGYVK